jgi:flagellin
MADDGDHARRCSDRSRRRHQQRLAQLASIGDSQSRLTFQQENLQVSMTNYESARSRISDADFAKEQMELVKLQILQQTGTAALAQANAAPQAVLSLF